MGSIKIHLEIRGLMTSSIDSFFHDLQTTIRNEETFLQDSHVENLEELCPLYYTCIMLGMFKYSMTH